MDQKNPSEKVLRLVKCDGHSAWRSKSVVFRDATKQSGKERVIVKLGRFLLRPTKFRWGLCQRCKAQERGLETYAIGFVLEGVFDKIWGRNFSKFWD